jgi:hypothetical protein
MLAQSFPPEEVSPSQIQMNLLASILETNANIDPDQLHLEFCTREDTATFYHTAMEILNQAVMMYCSFASLGSSPQRWAMHRSLTARAHAGAKRKRLRSAIKS